MMTRTHFIGHSVASFCQFVEALKNKYPLNFSSLCYTTLVCRGEFSEIAPYLSAVFFISTARLRFS